MTLETKTHTRETCDPRGTGRNDQKCPDCQREIARRVKKFNNYRAPGPMQTDSTRTWRKANANGR